MSCNASMAAFAHHGLNYMCTHENMRYVQASTPPSSWYLSPEVFELEKLAIFHRNWLVSLTPVFNIMQRHVHGRDACGEA